MSKTAVKPDYMYGVSRIDDDKYNTHAWRVSLARQGKKHVKNFPDKTFGNKKAALKKALQHRDEVVRKYPPLSRKEFCDLKRRNNKTGITGVYKYTKSYTLKDGTVCENWYWEAHWPTDEGESACQSFSVKKYGDEMAKQMAVRARKKGLKKVEGVFWAARRGDVEKSPARLFESIFSRVNESIEKIVNRVA